MKKLLKKASALLLAIVMICGVIAISPSLALTALAEDEIPIYQDIDNYSFEERAADLVARMTPAQKGSQMVSTASAIPALGINSYQWWSEAIHGHSRGNASNPMSYPVSYAAASSWNPDLYYDEATQIGDEIRESVSNRRVNLTLYSPTVNLARDPRWGRNDESYGEDPFLSGVMGSVFTQGMEGKDRHGNLLDPDGYYKTITTAKHYTANNSERNRLSGGANTDERSLREYYTAPYRDMLLNAGTSSIMTAYSHVNGVPASVSSYLMDTLLRKTWGFGGYITSDCDSVSTINNHQYINPYTGQVMTRYEIFANAMAHGEDLECNGGHSANIGNYNSNMTGMLSGNIMTDKGVFTENQVDISLHRLMSTRMKLGEFDGDDVSYVADANARLASYQGQSLTGRQTAERIKIATDIASEGIVLLKNDSSERKNGETAKLLPLNVPATGSYNVAIIGIAAQATFLGGYSANPGTTVTVENGIRNAIRAINPDANVTFYRGFTNGNNVNNVTAIDPAAIEAAAQADICIVVGGTDGTTSKEDGDRTTIALPGAQAQLIDEVGKANKNTVALLETCGPVQVTTFEESISSIVWSAFAGQNKGVAFANVLLGTVNPSGKTTALWHRNVNDVGVSDVAGILDYNMYKTETNPGRTYMYFDGPVSYPFGYGLSYTEFEYSDLQLDKAAYDANDTITATFKVKNTGTKAGAEVAQLYVSQPNAPAALQRPIKRLKGFDKITLAAGEEKTVTIEVNANDLAFFNEDQGKYVVDTGNYELQIGKSSSNVALNQTFTVSGTINVVPRVLTAVPNQSGDELLDIGERLIFNKGKVVNPQITVAMNDESLYGHILKGQSKALPAGAVVTYTSNRPAVVKVENGVITTVDQGVATITASLTYNGVTVTTDFVVYVASNPYPDGITVDGQMVPGFNKDKSQYSICLPYSVTTVPTVAAIESGNPDVTTVVTQATSIPGAATIVSTDASTNTSVTYTVGLTRPPLNTDFKTISTLPAEWRIQNSVPADVSFVSGSGLKIATRRGAYSSAENKPQNVVLTNAGGDWAAQTTVTLSAAPSVSNQQAGFIIRGDDNNYIKFVYERPATGNQAVVRVYEVINGAAQVQRNTANLPGQTTLHLQINKRNEVYTFLYSTNGTDWTTFATTVAVTYALPEIGLWANNGDTDAASIDATFDRLGIYDIGDVLPRLSSIMVGGVPLTSFEPDKLNYTLGYAEAGGEAPVVTATAANTNFEVEVTQATGIPGTAVITVRSSVASTTYNVSFNTFPTSASFVDGTVDEDWTILNENTNTYGLAKGSGLRLPVQRNEIGNNMSWENLFVRPAAGNWDVVVKMWYPTLPTGGGYPQGMLVVWQDNNNFIKFDCETASLTTQVYKRVNGSGASVLKVPATADPDGSVTLYLKASKDGDSYSFSFSKDGVTYVDAGETTAGFENVQIGLFATANGNNTTFQTYYEYATITRLNGVNVKSYEEMLQEAFDDVVEYVSEDIPAQTEGGSESIISEMPHGYTAEIVSSHPDIINAQGIVTRPLRDTSVTVSVKIADNAPIAHEQTIEKTVLVKGTQVGTLRVTYNLNGGTGTLPVDDNLYFSGDTYMPIAATDISREGYFFRGWRTGANNGNQRDPGKSFPITANVTLYAWWQAPINGYPQFSVDWAAPRLDRAAFMTEIGWETQIGIINAESASSWVSSDTSVATVDANGLVTATGNGDATVTAVINGVSHTCIVTVGYKGQNPFIPQSWQLYIPDGEPHVFDGVMYVYGSRDINGGSCSNRYNTIYTEDGIHWTDAGVSFTAADLPAPFNRFMNSLWAPDCVYNPVTDKYYLFSCGTDTDGEYFVAESDSPTGPFLNARRITYKNGPSDGQRIGNIDPGVFVDDDGTFWLSIAGLDGQQRQYYNTYGPSRFRYGEFDVATATIDTTTIIDVHDKMLEGDTMPFEGPSIRKFGDYYYMIYVSDYKNPKPAGLGLRTDVQPSMLDYLYTKDIRDADSWTYGGTFLNASFLPTIVNTHGSVEQFGDKYYVVYHNPMTQAGQRRSRIETVDIDPVTGIISPITLTSSGVRPAFEMGEQVKFSSAVDFSGGRWGSSPFAVQTIDGYQQMILNNLALNQYVGYRYVDFAENGAESVSIKVRTNGDNAKLQLTSGVPGSDNSTILAEIALPNTGNAWEVVNVPLDENVQGIQTVYAKLTNASSSGNISLDWFEFAPIKNYELQRVQENSEYLSFSDGWGNRAQIGKFDGHIAKQASKVGSSMSFKFKGNYFEIISYKSYSQGIFDIYVDGVKTGSVDLYTQDTDSLFNLPVGATRVLDGEHTVTLVLSGRNSSSIGNNVYVDAISVGGEFLPLQSESSLTDDLVIIQQVDTPTVIDVLANDSVSGTVSLGDVSPASGTVEVVDNKIVFTPALMSALDDSFTYKVGNEPATVRLTYPESVRYQETFPAVTAGLSGGNAWESFVFARYSGGSAIRSSKAGDTITVKFYGTGIDIIGYKSWSRGIVDITVDETKTTVDTFDMTYDKTYDQPIYSVSGLNPDDEHTLTIRVTGDRFFLASGSAIDIDAFVVKK